MILKEKYLDKKWKFCRRVLSVAWGIHGHIIMWHDHPIYNHQATKQEVYIVQGISMHHNDTESLRQHQNYETHIAKQI